MTQTALLTTAPGGDRTDEAVVLSGVRRSYTTASRRNLLTGRRVPTAEFEAVRGVDLTVRRGELFALLGTNGAGKTSTVELIEGLASPSAGEIRVLGHDPVAERGHVRFRTGVVLQSSGFPSALTVAEMARLWHGTLTRPLPVDAMLDAVDLAGRADVETNKLSGGERRRLDVALALMADPEVLILDEPTNGLDPPQIAAMRPILHAYAAGGRTVVISSHLLAEVEQTCSHVVVMHAGRVVTTGAVADLVASSDTTVVELGPAGATPTVVASALREIDGIRSVDVEDDGAHGKMTIVADRPRASVVSEVLSAGGDVVGVGSRRQLEEVFLGVIAAAAQVDGGSGLDGGASGRGSSGGGSGTDVGDSGQLGSEGRGTGAGDAARSGAGGPGMSADTGSLIEKLRQVRAR